MYKRKYCKHHKISVKRAILTTLHARVCGFHSEFQCQFDMPDLSYLDLYSQAMVVCQVPHLLFRLTSFKSVFLLSCVLRFQS